MPRDREFLPDLHEGFRPRQPRTERGQFHPTLTRREPLGNGSPGATAFAASLAAIRAHPRTSFC
jgi:hypothetical protein